MHLDISEYVSVCLRQPECPIIKYTVVYITAIMFSLRHDIASIIVINA